MKPTTAAKAITDVLRGRNVLMNERLGRRTHLNKTVTCIATRRVYSEPCHHRAQQPDQEEGPGCAMRGHLQSINEVQRRRSCVATQTGETVIGTGKR